VVDHLVTDVLTAADSAVAGERILGRRAGEIVRRLARVSSSIPRVDRNRKIGDTGIQADLYAVLLTVINAVGTMIAIVRIAPLMTAKGATGFVGYDKRPKAAQLTTAKITV